jgi:hypothetical protein
MSANITTEDIAESVRTRIELVRRELERYDALRGELTRLESALAELEPQAPTHASARQLKPTGTTRRRSPSDAGSQAPNPGTRDGRRATTAARRGQTRERIIEFIKARGPSTAGEVAKGLKLNPNSVATRLTQLAKAGDLEKAQRGYAAPGGNGGASS